MSKHPDQRRDMIEGKAGLPVVGIRKSAFAPIWSVSAAKPMATKTGTASTETC